MSLYPVKDCATAVGVTYRQLDYWINGGLVTTAGGPNHGSGYLRLFDEANGLRLTGLALLVQQGVPPRRAADLLDGKTNDSAVLRSVVDHDLIRRTWERSRPEPLSPLAERQVARWGGIGSASAHSPRYRAAS